MGPAPPTFFFFFLHVVRRRVTLLAPRACRHHASPWRTAVARGAPVRSPLTPWEDGGRAEGNIVSLFFFVNTLFLFFTEIHSLKVIGGI